MLVLLLGTVALGVLAWVTSMPPLIPRPWGILLAFEGLWKDGLFDEVVHSMVTNLVAMSISAVLSICISYATVLPVFRPTAGIISKARFLSLAGFVSIFALVVGGGFWLKIVVLVFGMTTFFVTSLNDVVAEIDREAFDHARTLRMNEWRVVWEVVVLGKADRVVEVLRQNFAMGWMMLTSVEGIVRSDGGIGSMMLNQARHYNLAPVFALQLVVVIIGIGQDYLIGALRSYVFPYVQFSLERK